MTGEEDHSAEKEAVWRKVELEYKAKDQALRALLALITIATHAGVLFFMLSITTAIDKLVNYFDNGKEVLVYGTSLSFLLEGADSLMIVAFLLSATLMALKSLRG